MSIGPRETTELPMSNRMERAFVATKKAANAYFEQPWHYLFYTAVLFIFVSLAFGRHVLWEFYILTLFLGLAELYNQTQKQKSLTEEK